MYAGTRTQDVPRLKARSGRVVPELELGIGSACRVVGATEAVGDEDADRQATRRRGGRGSGIGARAAPIASACGLMIADPIRIVQICVRVCRMRNGKRN